MEVPSRSLDDFVWMGRQVPSPVSSVNIIERAFYVGDIDGNMYVWNLDGDLCWNTDCGDRVESIVIASQHKPALLFATAGVDIICLDADSGNILWSNKLEGSSDEVVCTPNASVIVATSSVFDVEHLDFMESACWKFDSEGNILNLSRFDELPWYMGLLPSNEIIMGLGRPNYGATILSEINEYSPLDITIDSPVTCGTGREYDTILGHANGGITCILDSEEVFFSESNDSSSTSALDSSSDCVLQVQDSGKVTFFLENREKWNHNMDEKIERGTIGFEYIDSRTIWLAYQDKNGSKIQVLSGNDATSLCLFSMSSRVRAISSNDRFVIVGLEDGNVYVIESEQFSRRINMPKEENNDSDEESDYRRNMLEKLRNLNKD